MDAARYSGKSVLLDGSIGILSVRISQEFLGWKILRLEA